jgi:transcriptional regulator with AAA-type ATPase domain
MARTAERNTVLQPSRIFRAKTACNVQRPLLRLFSSRRMPTISDASSLPESQALIPRAHLFVVLECGRPLAGSSRHRIEELGEVLLGRGAGRTAERGGGRLTLTVPDGHMSSKHARLSKTEAGWLLEDQGSKNGVWVGTDRKDRVLLEDGDVIRVGHTVLLFREALPCIPGGGADVDMAPRFPGVVTLIPSFARELDRLARVAPTDLPILVLGETGTGKEIVARAIHSMSQRDGELVPVNCGAIPANLVESTLFGHKKGAFSGAVSDHPGLVKSADRGTLLLDEIGELPLPAQVSLLRVLQEMEVHPVGATRPIKVDVRVLAATHRDLNAQVEAGTFRADLHARLAGLTLTLPPLRNRREDIGLLIGALLGRMDAEVTLSPEAGVALVRHAWPRNLRELDLCLRSASAMAGASKVALSHLPVDVRHPTMAPPPAEDAEPEDLRQKLVASLIEHRGNVTHVARAMGKARMQIQRWMKRFSLDPSSFK